MSHKNNELNYVTFDWKIIYKINYYRNMEMFSTNDVTFLPCKSEEKYSLIYVNVSTTTFDFREAQDTAFEKVNNILNAYSVITGKNIELEYSCYELLGKPKNSGMLFLPSSAKIDITVMGKIEKKEIDDSIMLINKIDNSKYKDIYKNVVLWYRNGLSSADALDKFVYTWISFNALYNYFSNKKRELDRIHNLLEIYLLEDDIKNIFKKHIKTISLLAALNLKSQNGKRNYSDELKNSLQRTNYKNAIGHVLACIYIIRCNLFHGKESLSDNTISILKNVFIILSDILRQIIINTLK